MLSHSSMQQVSKPSRVLGLCAQILDGVKVWGLVGPLQQVNVVIPKPCLDDFGSVFGVIVLLEHEAPVQMKLPH